MKQSSLGPIWKQIVFSAILGLVALVGLLLITGYWRSMELYEKRIINGDIHDVWRVATDVGRWPDWDPHEEAGEIYGPFEVGTKAYSKPRGGPGAHWSLTVVNEGNSWSLINPMWLGTLNVENRYTQLPGGQVLCEKTMHVSGWILVTLFKMHFEKVTRQDMQATWAALEKQIEGWPNRWSVGVQEDSPR